jgi:hypothetical protein
MGYETKCAVRVRDSSGVRRADNATVLLETDELIVRGDARVRVPRASITKVSSRAGVVTVAAAKTTIQLALGKEAAEKWEAKIQQPPKRLIDKLDVKPGARVWLLNISDAELTMQVEERAGEVLAGRSASACDVVFAQVDHKEQIYRIDRAAAALTDSGSIWVVHPKGKLGVADTTIYARAKELGLTSTKVARISDTLSGEKLVRPRASRGK